MPATESHMRRAMVTGSSGFIGGHLCARLAPADSFRGIDLAPPPGPVEYHHIGADIRCPETLRDIVARCGRPDGVFHLAASAEVLTPWSGLPPLLSSNMEGTYNVLQVLDPKLVVFASSSSVYGNAGSSPVDPRHAAVRPLCLYAMSKLTAEMIVRDWARDAGGAAVIFRFGNVIGPGCRGLIPYLAGHALRYPEGGVPARLRGYGRLVRDYVPVDYVVRVLLAATLDWEPRSLVTLNLGAGRAVTNREVAEIVQQAVRGLGLQLDVSYDDAPGAGEADEVVLDMEETVKLFGIVPPSPDEVRESIAGAAVEFLRGARVSSPVESHA
ncbi:MAG TPA: NAD(P)-dependent oxidoreductase [Candidatus Sulfopaludibacter sp.]|nr:NAD(P)-dependent oxidoreductase [Candidatus Sulfopaludibacter sp.]